MLGLFEYVNGFRGKIAELKSLSPYWPGVFYQLQGDELWASTLVVFRSDDNPSLWYARHHVETAYISNTYTLAQALNMVDHRLWSGAGYTMAMGIPNHLDDLLADTSSVHYKQKYA